MSSTSDPMSVSSMTGRCAKMSRPFPFGSVVPCAAPSAARPRASLDARADQAANVVALERQQDEQRDRRRDHRGREKLVPQRLKLELEVAERDLNHLVL